MNYAWDFSLVSINLQKYRGLLHSLGPLPSVVNGGFKPIKMAIFPKNEHWRSRRIGESIPCEWYLPAEQFARFRLFMGKFHWRVLSASIPSVIEMGVAPVKGHARLDSMTTPLCARHTPRADISLMSIDCGSRAKPFGTVAVRAWHRLH